ncbi:MAG TPA: universal stress protein [Actinomycetales bacterium]|nr:universal stress protein [Actinomycetales bacterium]
MDLRSGGPLVVGVDGSPDSVRALDWALALAAPLSLPVRVLHARGRRHADRASSVADDLRVEALADYDGPTLRVTAVDDDSDPVPLLLEAGQTATAVVVGARGHGRLTGAVTGSVSQHVAQLATCPVVVVRPPADQLSRTVVLGVDEAFDEPGRLAPGSVRAAEFAFAYAEATAAPLTVLHAWQNRDLDRSGVVLPLKEELDAEDRMAAVRDLDQALERCVKEHPAVEVSLDVRPVHPQRLLTDASQRAALLVVGSRGRSLVPGLLLGSVSQATLHRASCPVAVVR